VATIARVAKTARVSNALSIRFIGFLLLLIVLKTNLFIDVLVPEDLKPDSIVSVFLG
jgi:hypothetical protein